MRKIINFVILVTFLSIATAYPSALRLPVGEIKQGRIEKAGARELLSQKLAQQGISVEDIDFHTGKRFIEGANMYHESFNSYLECEQKPGKAITRTQFESAVDEIVRVLSEYPDFVVVYSDFVFDESSVMDEELSNMNFGMGGMRSTPVYIDIFTLRSPSSIQIEPAGNQRTVEQDKGFFKRHFGWIERVFNPTRVAM